MADVYEITISDNYNQECFAALPTDGGNAEFTFHIRRCFGSVFLDAYKGNELLSAGNICLPNRYVFGAGGYALYYINETTLEWRKYDLA